MSAPHLIQLLPRPGVRRAIDVVSQAALDAAAQRAVDEAVAAGADGLEDDGAFWAQVERLLGDKRLVADHAPMHLRAEGVAVECSHKLAFRPLEFTRAIALKTLREAAFRRARG
jgi:hypothetical protein